MKQFFRRISPRRAIKDLIGQWRAPTQHRWPVLGVSLAMTFALFMFFIPKSERIVPQRPEVIFIATWEGDRTQEEIMASNCENQLRRDEREALLARRAELRRSLYSAMGRASGVDVDEMEEQARLERELAEAEELAAQQEYLQSEEAQAQLDFCEQDIG